MRFGGVKAVEELAFRVKEGIIMSIIGPNGAGKTTIFNCLTGLAKPEKGTIRFSSKDITGLAPHKIVRLGLARTFQNIRLFREMSVAENVMVAQHHRTRAGLIGAITRWKGFQNEERTVRERAMEYLAFVGLSDYADTICGKPSVWGPEKTGDCPCTGNRAIDAPARRTDGGNEPAGDLRGNVAYKKYKGTREDRLADRARYESGNGHIRPDCGDRSRGKDSRRACLQRYKKDPLVIEAYLGKEH